MMSSWTPSSSGRRQSNLDLRVAEARLAPSPGDPRRQRGRFWPTVDASGSYARAKQSQNQPFFGALPLPPNFPFEYSVYQAGFDASWEIDLFGGKRRALEAATAEWEGAIEARNDAMVSLLAEVARNYVELRGNQQRLEIAQRDFRLQEEALELTRARFQSGVATELDVTRAAALLAGMQAAIPPLETDVRAAMYGLAVLLGQEPGELVAELVSIWPIPPAAAGSSDRAALGSSAPSPGCATSRTATGGRDRPHRSGEIGLVSQDSP